ncbi:MAG: uroporphyrinogen-III synthase [Rikenellaceae bacterium]
MSIQNILVSQPTPAIVEKSPFYEVSQRLKFNVDYHPLIKVEGVKLKEFRAQRVEILDHTAIIFTSRSTIDSFFEICEAARITIPDTMKYICQREAVALYLQKYIVYRKRKISFADGSFNSLIELMVKNKGEKMLLTLSEPHKPELPEAMAKIGLNFTEAILARTVASDMSKIEISKYEVIALYSPSDVKALIENYTPEQLPMVATFGNATHAAAVEAGLSVKTIAPTPKAPSMAKAIELLIERVNSGEPIDDIALPENKSNEEFLKSQQNKLVKRTSRAVRA